MRGRIPHTLAQDSNIFCEGLAVPGPHPYEDAVVLCVCLLFYIIWFIFRGFVFPVFYKTTFLLKFRFHIFLCLSIQRAIIKWNSIPMNGICFYKKCKKNNGTPRCAVGAKGSCHIYIYIYMGTLLCGVPSETARHK